MSVGGALRPLPAGPLRIAHQRSVVQPRTSSPTTAIVTGIALGAALQLASGLAILPLIVALAGLVLVAAVVAPRVGLAVLAATVALHDVDAIKPLGFAVMLVAALVLGVLLREVVARPRSGPSLVTMLAAGYLALAAVTLIPVVSGLDYEQTVGALYELLQLASILATVGVARHVLGTTDARPYLWLGLGSAVVTCALALFLMGYSSFDAVPLRPLFTLSEYTSRAIGPYNDPNYFGLALAVATMLGLTLARVTAGWQRWIALAMCAVFAVTILLTFSRGALVAVTAGLVIAVLLISRRAAALLTVAVIAGVLFLGPVFLNARLAVTTGGIYSQPYRELASSDSTRTDALLAGIRLVGDSPVFGTGFGQFRFRAERYIGDNATSYPHNSWIKILAELGFAGGAVFAAVILAGVLLLARARRVPGALVVWPALVAYAVGATFLEPIISLQTSGLLAIAVGAAIAAGDAGRPVPASIADRLRAGATPHRPRVAGA